jgi:TPP-dependent pyruvate/acetoin dehydrogenase alpha subunit
MRRYPLFDPPEYLNWAPAPDLLTEYQKRIESDPERAQVIAGLSKEQLLGLYAGMLRFRLHDYALKRWVRQGVISKAWLGTGEEAVTVGNVHALERGRDIVAPMIRNAGACHELGMSIEEMLLGYLATADSPNGGFDLHIGDLGKGVLQPISHVGEMVPVITGVALAFKRKGEARVALTWIGDGATKTGAVHEGLNFAAVLRVPAIFVIQNNQVALGTRLEQHQAGDFRAWGEVYGLPLAVADGNNVLDVYAATRIAADRARGGGGPTVLLVNTFRMGGHATHDEAEARDTFAAELFDYWGRRDPIGLYEEYLVGSGIGRSDLSDIENSVVAEVDSAAERAAAARVEKLPRAETAELAGVSAGARQPGLTARLAGFYSPEDSRTSKN